MNKQQHGQLSLPSLLSLCTVVLLTWLESVKTGFSTTFSWCVLTQIRTLTGRTLAEIFSLVISSVVTCYRHAWHICECLQMFISLHLYQINCFILYFFVIRITWTYLVYPAPCSQAVPVLIWQNFPALYQAFCNSPGVPSHYLSTQ